MSSDPVARRALVTGASSGIGEEFVRQLARRGDDVVLVARRRNRLDAIAAELSGVQVEVLVADLANDAGAATVEERLRRGDIDLLVNNAGFATVGEFSSLPIGRELEEIDVNVRVLVRLCHAVLASMIARGRGSIINVASTAAFQPIPNQATYAATKAFVLHFTEALYEENRKHGVSVTALCPGPVRTEFMEVAELDGGAFPSLAYVSTERVVATALRAAHAGRAIAIPGVVNRIGAATTRLMPRFVMRRIAGGMIRRRDG